MKKILNFGLAAVLAISSLCSCSEDGPETVEYLPVTANNIAGTWQLVEQGGSALAEGSYVYLDIVRRDNEFTLYEKIWTFSTDISTGEYHIDEDTGVIRGKYDHSYKDWNHSYAITELTSGRMVWTAVDDPQDVSVYLRVERIPDDVLGSGASDDTEDSGTAE